MTQIAAALASPLGYPFVRYGLLEVLLMGAASGLVGVFVVQRQLSFFAHALSHAIFPAVIIAAMLHVDMTAGAMVGAIVTVVLIFGLQRHTQVGHSSAVGVVFTALFAFGVVLSGLLRVQSPDLSASLVGNILGVGAGDLALGLLLLLLLTATVYVLFWPLSLASFDRTTAAITLPLAQLDLALLGLVGGTAVITVRIVGVVLTVAVLMIPAAAALRWTRRLRRAMVLAAAVATFSGLAGLYAAYYVPVAAAAVVILTLVAAFVASLALGPYGLLGTRKRLLSAHVPRAE